jgi:hypothetical protein
MAPKKEYYGLSAYSSVGALKLALIAMEQDITPANGIQALKNTKIK